MLMKYAGMMEERDPLVAEWASTIRVDEVPIASAQKVYCESSVAASVASG